MPLLRAENVHKRYGGVRALRGVGLEVEEGEVHALMGENGAGKSTLGKVIAGVVPQDEGALFLEGRRVHVEHPMDAQRLGISIIFQELDLFPNLTVAENIVIGNLARKDGVWVDRRELEAFCRPFLDRVGLRVPASRRLGELAIGEQQLVAIARALSMEARLIVMDEPTSALPDDAVDVLFGVIDDLRRSGVAIVYVSHKMDEIFRIADRITVLRDGAYAGTRRADETDESDLIHMMVGRELSSEGQSPSHATGAVLLSVEGASTQRLRDLSFDLHRGEVLGLAGLVGAGRSEVGQMLFGLDALQSGTLMLKGRAYQPHSPREAMRRSIGFLPEDRKTQGLMMNLSVRENASLAVLDRLQTAGFVHTDEERRQIERIHRRTSLKAASDEVVVDTLSGGNQQKVLLARWLLLDPDILFLDDPTRGIDVGSKHDIYEIIAELAADGKGILFVSSELPELLRCCDRIMVLHEGACRGILPAAQTTQEDIMTLAATH